MTDSTAAKGVVIATSVTGDVSHGVFLGDTMVPGLAANSSVNVLASVQFPSKLPYGTTVVNPAYLRIYAIADPEDVVNESTRSNNMAASAPVRRRRRSETPLVRRPRVPVSRSNSRLQ